MEKKVMVLGLLSVIAAVSCGLIKKNNPEEGTREAVAYQQGEPKNDAEIIAPVEPKPIDNPRNNERGSDQPAPTPPTQYDTKALDERVRQAALRANQDPKTFRLPISQENGTTVYRMIGMHVIVSALGEETFLPDEI